MPSPLGRQTLTGATTEFWSGASPPTSPSPAATTRETPPATVSVTGISLTIPNEDHDKDSGRISRRETTTGMARQKSTDSAGNPGSSTRRLSITEKLKKLGREINVLRKGSTSASSREMGIPASPVTTTSPPALSPTPISSSVVGRHAKLLSMVDESDEFVESTPSKPPPSEPESLAKKIQDLINFMPFPQPGEWKPIPIVKNPKHPARDKDSRPSDSKLPAFLSSATIMKGSDTGRQSIWSMLESLGAPPHGFPPTNDKDEETTTPPGSGEGGHDTDGDGSPDIVPDTSSFMVCSPLIPDRKDLRLVELAATLLTPVHPPTTSLARHGDNFGLSPLSGILDQLLVPASCRYLPPPVLEILDDKNLEATKRAAKTVKSYDVVGCYSNCNVALTNCAYGDGIKIVEFFESSQVRLGFLKRRAKNQLELLVTLFYCVII
ncbi:hypothetical protein BJ165DRAFT_1402975 [Panaeolus papilionaceus]|nr:hypothetical protein BJ165DRAFT_1402975 [Panaeolus papilionaceus]